MPETIYEMAKRMCNTLWRNNDDYWHCNKDGFDLCKDCPIRSLGESCIILAISQKNPAVSVEKQLDVLRKWAEEHPVKTYKDVLFEKFPKAALGVGATLPPICRKALFGEKLYCDNFLGRDNKQCMECWNEPYKK